MFHVHGIWRGNSTSSVKIWRIWTIRVFGLFESGHCHNSLSVARSWPFAWAATVLWIPYSDLSDNLPKVKITNDHLQKTIFGRNLTCACSTWVSIYEDECLKSYLFRTWRHSCTSYKTCGKTNIEFQKQV